MLPPLCIRIEHTAMHLTLPLQAQSFMSRQRHCFLEQFKWKTIPWALDSSLRLLGLRVQDIRCDVPGFLEDTLTLRALKTDGNSVSIDLHGASLRSRVTAAIEQLCALRWEWKGLFPAVCCEVVCRPGSTLCVDDSGEPLFQTVLFFRGRGRAMEILSFNTLFLILYNILSLIEADSVSVCS